MSEEEIKKAIENGQLPVRHGSMMPIYLVLAIISTIGCLYLFNFHLQKSQIIPYVALVGFGVILGIWLIYSNKGLEPLLSTLPFDKKIIILEKLIHTLDINHVSMSDGYCQLKTNSDALNPIYKITILYDENGYYINTLNIERGERSAGNQSQELIEKIKELESNYSLNTAADQSSL